MSGDIDPATSFDAILLGYGLCSNAVIGLSASRHKLVIPRAHDCITMFLGSKENYAKYFSSLSGCYWYTDGWIENACMPCEEQYLLEMDSFRRKGYDEDTAQYLSDEMNGLKNYKNAAYIQMPSKNAKSEEYLEFTKTAAAFYHWNFHLLEGNMDLMKRFINGEWNEEDFLVLEPKETAVPSYDSGIIKKAKRNQ